MRSDTAFFSAAVISTLPLRPDLGLALCPGGGRLCRSSPCEKRQFGRVFACGPRCRATAKTGRSPPLADVTATWPGSRIRGRLWSLAACPEGKHTREMRRTRTSASSRVVLDPLPVRGRVRRPSSGSLTVFAGRVPCRGPSAGVGSDGSGRWATHRLGSGGPRPMSAACSFALRRSTVLVSRIASTSAIDRLLDIAAARKWSVGNRSVRRNHLTARLDPYWQSIQHAGFRSWRGWG